MPETFYKVVVDGEALPLMRLAAEPPCEFNVGSKISVPSLKRPQFHIRDIITSIDHFAKLDDVRKHAAINDLHGPQPQWQESQVVRLEADSEPGCLGRLVIREVTRD